MLKTAMRHVDFEYRSSSVSDMRINLRTDSARMKMSMIHEIDITNTTRLMKVKENMYAIWCTEFDLLIQ